MIFLNNSGDDYSLLLVLPVPVSWLGTGVVMYLTPQLGLVYQPDSEGLGFVLAGYRGDPIWCGEI